MAFELNNSEDYDALPVIRIKDYPRIFTAKCEELIEEGVASDMESAKKIANDITVELELYYEKGTGLFAVESEAVESTEIYSPYTGEMGTQPQN